MNDFIKSDMYRYYAKTDMITFIKALITSSTFRFQVVFRMCQGNRIENLVGTLLWSLNRTKSRICLPRKTKVGYGLYIAHGGPIIINETAIIGNNVNLSQFTTIGANDGKAAIIGDNCYIAPNVCIIENVVIGNNVTIGAGSVVTKSIPDNATAVGNYAKVINYNEPGKYIQNKWPIKNNVDC